MRRSTKRLITGLKSYAQPRDIRSRDEKAHHLRMSRKLNGRKATAKRYKNY